MFPFSRHSKIIDKTPEYSQTVEALENVRKFLLPTPVTYSHIYSETSGLDVYLKWENRLRTGSFKERGAINFLLNIPSSERKKSVCAASAGNHALGLSYHAQREGINCILVMPKSAPLIKAQTAESFGAKVILHGNTFDEAKIYAEELSKKEGHILVPAYDHHLIIAGQATAAHELIEQVENFDSVIVPVGGGGLISGMALVLKEKRPDIFIMGVQSEWALSGWKYKKGVTSDGEVIPPVTIADGIGVKSLGKLTEEIVKNKVDKLVSVSESEIASSIVQFLEREHTLAEGAGVVGITALLRGDLPSQYKKPVVMITGSNIDLTILSRLIVRDLATHNRIKRLRLSVPDRPGCLRAVTGVVSKTGANILEVTHDRSFAEIPGNVEITIVAEIRDEPHGDLLMEELVRIGAQTLSY